MRYLGMRLFRYSDRCPLILHRMKAVEALDVPAMRPAGLDLDACIASGGMGLGSGEAIWIEWLIEADAARYLADIPLASDRPLTPAHDGWMCLRATFSYIGQWRWWILGFGDKAEVKKTGAPS